MEQNGKPKNQRTETGGPAWMGLAQLVVVCATLVAVVWIVWG